MHDGDHDILGSHADQDDHDHDHDHDHDEDSHKKKSDKAIKVIAGLLSIGLIVAFALWKLI